MFHSRVSAALPLMAFAVGFAGVIFVSVCYWCILTVRTPDGHVGASGLSHYWRILTGENLTGGWNENSFVPFEPGTAHRVSVVPIC